MLHGRSQAGVLRELLVRKPICNYYYIKFIFGISACQEVNAEKKLDEIHRIASNERKLLMIDTFAGELKQKVLKKNESKNQNISISLAFFGLFRVSGFQKKGKKRYFWP